MEIAAAFPTFAAAPAIWACNIKVALARIEKLDFEVR